MVRTFTVITFLALGVAWVPATASEANTSPKHNTKPIQRDYGEYDACFGDKYETDEDLKTGKEHKIEQILKLMLQPGT